MLNSRRNSRDQPAPAGYPIIDGFLYRRQTRCDLRFANIALDQFEALRRANGMKTRMWVFPEDPAALVPNLDSLEGEIPIPPGSALWGYYINAESAPPFASTILQIRDACTGIALFSEPVSGPGAPAWPTQVCFPQLLIIGEPGLLTVEIAAIMAPFFPEFFRNIQLVLYGGQPASK